MAAGMTPLRRSSSAVVGVVAMEILEIIRVITAVVVASCVLWFVFAAIFAPEGYEDDTGFHYGARADREGK